MVLDRGALSRWTSPYVRLNVTDWWDALVPEPLSHRVVLLTATCQVSAFVSEAAKLVYLIQEDRPCKERADLLQRAVAYLEKLRHWARGLVSFGSLRFPDGSLVGAGGVIQKWTDELSRIFYTSEFEHICMRPLDDEPIRQTVAELMLTQYSWPWLIDSAAVVTRTNIKAQVPLGIFDAVLDAEILKRIIDHYAWQSPLVVEVGVDRGKTSLFLLAAFPSLRLIGIDPYAGIYGGVPSSERPDGIGATHFYKDVAAQFQEFGHRAKLIRSTSLEVARTWNNGPVDLVFIDGEHYNHSCREDIMAWSALVRPGGIVAGDDFTGGGIAQVVYTLLPSGATLNLAPNGVWWWQQPGPPSG